MRATSLIFRVLIERVVTGISRLDTGYINSNKLDVVQFGFIYDHSWVASEADRLKCDSCVLKLRGRGYFSRYSNSLLAARSGDRIPVGGGDFPHPFRAFLRVKRRGRGVDHPPPSGAEVKERVELYHCSPLYDFLACYTVNFTFYRQGHVYI